MVVPTWCCHICLSCWCNTVLLYGAVGTLWENRAHLVDWEAWLGTCNLRGCLNWKELFSLSNPACIGLCLQSQQNDAFTLIWRDDEPVWFRTRLISAALKQLTVLVPLYGKAEGQTEITVINDSRLLWLDFLHVGILFDDVEILISGISYEPYVKFGLWIILKQLV